MEPIPESLGGRAFTRRQAHEAGVSDDQLRGRRFVRLSPGVYRTAETEESWELRVDAARLVLPGDAALSHVSNLRWRGLEVGPAAPVHFATNASAQRVRSGVVVHRYGAPVLAEKVRGLPLVDPYRTFVDCATIVGVRTLVVIGDWLVACGLVDPARLIQYADTVHFDGVRRSRRAAPLVRRGSASPRESELRWELDRAGLPEPEINANIHDDFGGWLARGDLVYRRWKLLVEYDGWYHERSSSDRQHDLRRRESLEAAGWRVIIVTSADMTRPGLVAARVHLALVDRGWRP
jgi:very-short-patch-repair endonuclease